MRKLSVPILLAVGAIVIVIILIIGYVTKSSTPPPSTASPQTVAPLAKYKEYFFALEADSDELEKTSCGDGIIPVERWVSTEGNSLRNLYQDVLSLHDKTYELTGLFNALWQSSLDVQEATIVDGLATIKLTGVITKSDNCDAERIKIQLERLAVQIPGVAQTVITINDKTLDQALAN